MGIISNIAVNGTQHSLADEQARDGLYNLNERMHYMAWLGGVGLYGALTEEMLSANGLKYKIYEVVQQQTQLKGEGLNELGVMPWRVEVFTRQTFMYKGGNKKLSDQCIDEDNYVKLMAAVHTLCLAHGTGFDIYMRCAEGYFGQLYKVLMENKETIYSVYLNGDNPNKGTNMVRLQVRKQSEQTCMLLITAWTMFENNPNL